MTTYIDPTTELPQNLGEIYSDRNLRIVGQARINPLNSNQIDTLGIQVLCTPIGGGAEGISNITNGTYTLSGAGSSLWVKITRSGTATVTPEIYAAGAQPKSRRDYVQVFYQSSATQIVCINSFIYYGPLYTRLGYGLGQRIYDAIVGNAGDDHATHTDLQTAVNDAPANGWILVKKMCLVTTTITTASKSLKLVFQGTGTGLQASGATTGIIFSATGSQLVGLGTITGFTTYGVNLNNQTNCRIEMLFSGNTANINYGTLNGTQYNLEGSIGLTEDAHIQISTSHGTMARWHNTTKRWEPITGITVDDSGNMSTTQKITATVGFVGPGINPVGSLLAILNASPITGGGYTIPPSGTVDSNGWMYCNGAAIPAGNTLTGSAPNLTDGRYLRGSTVSGTTGGANTVVLSSANLPLHTHAISFNSGTEGSHYHASVALSGNLVNANELSHTHSWGGIWNQDNSDLVASPEGDGGGNTYSNSVGYWAPAGTTFGSTTEESSHTHEWPPRQAGCQGAWSTESAASCAVAGGYGDGSQNTYSDNNAGVTTWNSSGNYTWRETAGFSTSHTHGDTGTISANHTHSGTTDPQNANHTHGYTRNTGGAIGLGGGTYAGYSEVGASTGGISADHGHNYTTGGVSSNHTHSTGWADRDHSHTYYLPSHRNWIMTRATTTGSSHVHPEKQYAHRHWIKSRNTSAGTTHTHPISGHTGAVCAADGTTAATHLHLISGSTGDGGFANTAHNNEPQYINVVYLIRVK